MLFILLPICFLAHLASGVLKVSGASDGVADLEVLPPCMEERLQLAYSRDMPILRRLELLENIMKEGDCMSIEFPQQERSLELGPSDKIGPPEFVKSMSEGWKAAPDLLQVQSTGITFDAADLEKLRAIGDECVYEVVDEGVPQDVLDWTMCTLYEKNFGHTPPTLYEKIFGQMPPKKGLVYQPVPGSLRLLLRELAASQTLLRVWFSRLAPKSLVEWHGDYIFNLLCEDGASCRQVYNEDFDGYDGPHPWRELHLEILRLHLPLTAHEDVHIFMSGARLRMRPGDLVFFDFLQPHALYNKGDEPRVHLLFDFRLPGLEKVENARRLLQTSIGRAILAALLRMGYHDVARNKERQSLEWLLHKYQMGPCFGKDPLENLSEEATTDRLLLERLHAGMLEFLPDEDDEDADTKGNEL